MSKCVLCHNTEDLHTKGPSMVPGMKPKFCPTCMKWGFPDSYNIGKLIGMLDEICGYIEDENEHRIDSFVDIWWEMREGG